MIWKLLLRDLSLVGVTIALWTVEATERGNDSLKSILLSIAVAAMTVLCGYLAHEWGHLLGTRLSNGVFHLPPRVLTVFLFKFDPEQNNRSQFLAMGMGGFIASAIVVVLYLLVLPLDALSGRVALAITILGVAATFILEVPPFVKVFRGGAIPRGIAYESSGSK